MIIDDKKFTILLKKVGITKTSLCKELAISSPTMAKIKKGENVRDEIVEKIANFFTSSNRRHKKGKLHLC